MSDYKQLVEPIISYEDKLRNCSQVVVFTKNEKEWAAVVPSCFIYMEDFAAVVERIVYQTIFCKNLNMVVIIDFSVFPLIKETELLEKHGIGVVYATVECLAEKQISFAREKMCMWTKLPSDQDSSFGYGIQVMDHSDCCFDFNIMDLHRIGTPLEFKKTLVAMWGNDNVTESDFQLLNGHHKVVADDLDLRVHIMTLFIQFNSHELFERVVGE